METTCENFQIFGVSLPDSGPTLSHLIFSDNVIFMGEWSKLNVVYLNRVLMCLFLAFGLKVNLQKSKVYGLCVEDLEVTRLACISKCEPTSFPFYMLVFQLGLT